MIKAAFTSPDERENVLSYLKQKQYKRVLEIGGGLWSWADEVVTHHFDIVPIRNSKKVIYKGDIEDSFARLDLIADVAEEGEFDYLICSHCLEHVGNIKRVLRLFQDVAKEGFISVPNKYTELSYAVSMGNEGLDRCKLTGHIRGFAPHRWVFGANLKEGQFVLTAVPKFPFIEKDAELDGIIEQFNYLNGELCIHWEGDIPCYVYDDTYFDYSDPQKAIEAFRRIIAEGFC